MKTGKNQEICYTIPTANINEQFSFKHQLMRELTENHNWFKSEFLRSSSNLIKFSNLGLLLLQLAYLMGLSVILGNNYVYEYSPSQLVIQMAVWVVMCWGICILFENFLKFTRHEEQENKRWIKF